MTTLADLQVGDQILYVGKVVSLDVVAGIGLTLWGPAAVQAATAQITPAGVMSGQLAAAPNLTPVTKVTGFAAVSVGDILENTGTGETLACRWSQIDATGTAVWSASVDHKVTFTASGWTVIGHIAL